MGNRLMGSGKARMIDKAQEAEPRRGGDADKTEKPADGHKHAAGPETKYSRSAWTGNPSEHNPLRGATEHLRREHPIKHDDHGPHHGKKHHITHMPLHGMHPKGSHRGGK